MQEYILAGIGLVIALIIVFITTNKHSKIRKKYFPSGITQEGLDKMRISVSATEYKKFVKKTAGAIEAQFIANKEKGILMNVEMKGLLELLKKELRNYE